MNLVSSSVVERLSGGGGRCVKQIRIEILLHLIVEDIPGHACAFATLASQIQLSTGFAKAFGAIVGGGSDLVIRYTFTQTHVHSSSSSWGPIHRVRSL